MDLLMSADKVRRVPPRKGNVEVQCGSSRTETAVLEQGYFSPQHQPSLEEALRALSTEPGIRCSRERGEECSPRKVSSVQPCLTSHSALPAAVNSLAQEC